MASEEESKGSAITNGLQLTSASTKLEGEKSKDEIKSSSKKRNSIKFIKFSLENSWVFGIYTNLGWDYVKLAGELGKKSDVVLFVEHVGIFASRVNFDRHFR